MEKKVDFIIRDFHKTQGTQEGCRVYTITGVHDGKTEVVIEKTVSARYPVQKLNEVLDLHEKLTGGGGRRIISIDDIYAIASHAVKIPYPPKKAIE